MSIQVVYTCVPGAAKTLTLCTRFAATYHAFPGGIDHEFIVICNGGEPSNEIKATLATIKAKILVRSNDGWDIGGYREFSNTSTADFMVCLGESVYFHRKGWLERLVEAFSKYGDGMYGIWSSNLVRPHILTTAFATQPKFLKQYPHPTRNKEQRYAFEHGRNSFMNWLKVKGVLSRLVTWDGFWNSQIWRAPSNILWRGNQSNCLAFCNHTDNYERATRLSKVRWESMANGVR